MSTVFFGYSGTPKALGETFRTVAEQLSSQLPGVEGITWEHLEVAGKLVISEVLSQIDVSEMCAFDVTRLNANVLFEVGYAIAKGKPIWLLRDSTISAAEAEWRELAILKPVGYETYRNSDDLLAKFAQKDPLNALTAVYDELIDPALPDEPEAKQSVLYCPTFAQYEASNRLSKLIDDRRRNGISVYASDPQESSFESLIWYAPIILKSAGVLVHFAAESRTRARTFNMRHALVAGMATGFETPVLMLAEREYESPFDYEELLKKYDMAQECVGLARNWLDGLVFDHQSWARPRRTFKSGMRGLRFGEHVAENELDTLPDYFVETAAYSEVVAARDAIFVGHRGTGKTANATQAFEEIALNKTNMAVLIKPPGFEFPALMQVVEGLPGAQHDYFFDALWRFVIQSEIGAEALRIIESKPISIPKSQVEKGFLSYVRDSPFDLHQDVSVRLEQAFDFLLSKEAEAVEGQSSRDLINEAFHTTALRRLRHELGPILKDRKRVAVFVDNLDKGWERNADFKLMARFILGLLTARGRVVSDFARHDFWRDKIKLTLAIFLRSDIYNYLKSEAREPDKLPLSTISWRDPETLLAVVESRFSYTPYGQGDPEALWKTYFSKEVDGTPVKEYLTTAVLPRPRDVVYFCNAAVGYAIDRRHPLVEEADFKAAEAVYSQYAYEALLVENGVTIPEMEDALFAFLGAPELLARAEVLQRLTDAGIGRDRHEIIFEKLLAAYFLGLETHEDEFHFPEVGADMRRSHALADHFRPVKSQQRLQVHRAFHDFLQIQPREER